MDDAAPFRLTEHAKQRLAQMMVERPFPLRDLAAVVLRPNARYRGTGASSGHSWVHQRRDCDIAVVVDLTRDPPDVVTILWHTDEDYTR